MVAGENEFFMRTPTAIFNMLPQVVADGIDRLGSNLEKPLPVVADGKGVFRTTL